MGLSRLLAFATAIVALLWLAAMCVSVDAVKSETLRNEVINNAEGALAQRRLPPFSVGPKVFEFFTNSFWNLYTREFKPWDVDFTKVTHLVYGFFSVTENCEVGVIDGGYLDFHFRFDEMGMNLPDYDGPLGIVGAFKLLQEWVENAGLNRFKLIMSLGGWNHSEHFSECAATAANRSTLAASIAAFVAEHQFDGVNVNWQWPGPHSINGGGTVDDINNYVELMGAIREALHVSVEVSINQGMAPDVLLEYADGDNRLCGMVDYVLLHTYDYNGHWNDQTGFNAPLNPPAQGDDRYCIQWGLSQLLNRMQCEESKLVLGVPGFGTCWSGVVPGDAGDGLWQPGPTACQGTNEPGKVKYYEMHTDNYPPEFEVHNENSEDYIVPYWYRDQVFVSFDNVYSVGVKTNVAARGNMAGFLLFEAVDDREMEPSSVDMGHGLGYVKTYELLSASLQGWTTAPTSTTTSVPMSTTTTRAPSSSTVGDTTTRTAEPMSTTTRAPSSSTVGDTTTRTAEPMSTTTTRAPSSSTVGDTTTRTAEPTTTRDDVSTTTTSSDGSSTRPWYNMDRYMNKFINLYLDRFHMPDYLDMYIDRFINRYISSPRPSSTSMRSSSPRPSSTSMRSSSPRSSSTSTATSP